MSEGLRAEDVKEALGHYDEWGTGVDHLGRYEQVKPLVAAARDHLQCLASQEQTPDYQAAAKAIWRVIGEVPSRVFGEGSIYEVAAHAAVDAALVGFHPQPEGDER